MNSLARAFGYLIAANFQAIGLVMLAWFGGDWLNKHHPIELTWYAITFPVAVVAVGHTYYVVIRHALKQASAKPSDESRSPKS